MPTPQTSAAPRLGIGVIGAGRVGAVLGAALHAEGHAITGAYAVSDASRERAAKLLPEAPVLSVPEIVERSEMLLLAVPDDQLPELVSGIAAAGIAPGGQLVVHTSGRFGVEVLHPLESAGAVGLALHPAMTFSGTALDLPRLIGCPFALTARGHYLAIAQALVVELGGTPVTVPEGDRGLYHAALAHGANHLVVLVDQAREVLDRIGIEAPGEYLRPLLQAALDNALRHGEKALTGPAMRGDAGTISAHLEALADLDATGGPGHVGDIAAGYRVLARAAVDRAGLDAATADRIRAILDETPTSADRESTEEEGTA